MRDRAKEKEIFAAATEGPWRKGKNSVITDSKDKNVWCDAKNAEFIAAARTGWPQDLVWRERAEGLLKELEWAQNGGQCPFCQKWKDTGHTPNCELAALLEGRL